MKNCDLRTRQDVEALPRLGPVVRAAMRWDQATWASPIARASRRAALRRERARTLAASEQYALDDSGARNYDVCAGHDADRGRRDTTP